MPELPEVETVRRTLEPLVVGNTFTHVTLHWPGCDARGDGRSLGESLPGAKCTGVGRRGKYLLLHLDRDGTLVMHLRMTGRLLVVDAKEPALRHERVRIAMDNGLALCFADQRKFGRLSFATDRVALAHVLRRLGPEPGLSRTDLGSAPTSLSVDYLSSAFANRRAPVKGILLDQRVIAGLGNIYVDEVLFVAKVHPATRGRDVGRDAVQRIAFAVPAVLAEAIADGGTTLSDYRDANGETGAHQTRLRVFRRHGKPCHDCGTVIERRVVAQRGTHACPRCQPLMT